MLNAPDKEREIYRDRRTMMNSNKLNDPEIEPMLPKQDKGADDNLWEIEDTVEQWLKRDADTGPGRMKNSPWSPGCTGGNLTCKVIGWRFTAPKQITPIC